MFGLNDIFLQFLFPETYIVPNSFADMFFYQTERPSLSDSTIFLKSFLIISCLSTCISSSVRIVNTQNIVTFSPSSARDGFFFHTIIMQWEV